MKKVFLAILVIIKNATIIMPLMEGMINALVEMIEQDNNKGVKNEKSSDTSHTC